MRQRDPAHDRANFIANIMAGSKARPGVPGRQRQLLINHFAAMSKFNQSRIHSGMILKRGV